jgi:hypothetical protein
MKKYLIRLVCVWCHRSSRKEYWNCNETSHLVPVYNVYATVALAAWKPAEKTVVIGIRRTR